MVEYGDQIDRVIGDFNVDQILQPSVPDQSGPAGGVPAP